jgi:hypothetical protein
MLHRFLKDSLLLFVTSVGLLKGIDMKAKRWEVFLTVMDPCFTQMEIFIEGNG